jgi:aspartyl-tRNA(Asn)/glutamyl-tRNA(Gln) amidotransferase subunit C
MISKEEVQHIAKLARLELNEQEIEKMQKDLSEILDYFEVLNKVPKIKGEAVFAESNKLRKDEVVDSHDIVDELVALAPDKKDDYIKVKSILK